MSHVGHRIHELAYVWRLPGNSEKEEVPCPLQTELTCGVEKCSSCDRFRPC